MTMQKEKELVDLVPQTARKNDKKIFMQNGKSFDFCHFL